MESQSEAEKELLQEIEKAEKEEVIEHDDGSVTVELRVPITRKHERIESVTMRRPNASELMLVDLAQAQARNLSSCVKFIHAISSLSKAEVEGMDGADFVFLCNVAIARFFRRRASQLARAGG